MTSSASSPATPMESSFEQELHRLHDIVGQLESGELSLEATIAAFQQGSGLVVRCQRLIAEAELRITKLAEAPIPGDEGAPGSSHGDLHRQLPGL